MNGDLRHKSILNGILGDLSYKLNTFRFYNRLLRAILSLTDDCEIVHEYQLNLQDDTMIFEVFIESVD